MTPDRHALIENLWETLEAAQLISTSLTESREIVGRFLPVQAAQLKGLPRRDLVEINAFLFQFLQLASLLQDKLTRLILRVSDEDTGRASRLDMRNMLEKLGALDPAREFGAIAEIRNRLAHDYPLQPERKARSINEAFRRSADLLGGHGDMAAFATSRFFPASRR